jgi:hypothetical protein
LSGASPAAVSFVFSAGNSVLTIAFHFAMTGAAAARALAIAFNCTVVGRTSAAWSELMTAASAFDAPLNVPAVLPGAPPRPLPPPP